MKAEPALSSSREESALRDTALLLLGHGSTLNADSSAPTWLQAEEIRRRGIFAEVQVGFWKEEPNFRQALRQTRRARVCVVPNFISSGYFTEQIIPRELGLDGAVTAREGQDIVYCQPIGLHPAMTEALLQRAREVVAGSAEKIERPAQTACLFICGHGTSFNDNSTRIIHEQAAAIRARGIFADCQAVLMEQAPFVRDWRTLTSCPDVIVAPFFIADGLHSYDDIPVLLGLAPNMRGKKFANPHREPGRRLWYATAIGSEKFVADVIIAQAREGAEQFAAARRDSGAAAAGSPSLEAGLEQLLGRSASPWTIGQVLIQSGFELRHVEDAARQPGELRLLAAPEDLREMARLDEGGNFRPLRDAPNLRRSWIYRAADLAALRLALDYIYPAEVANAVLAHEGKLVATPWRETAQRQSGRFRVVREVTDEMAEELVATICERGCLKTRLWPPATDAPQAEPSRLPLLCPEACNFLVARAREKLKGPADE